MATFGGLRMAAEPAEQRRPGNQFRDWAVTRGIEYPALRAKRYKLESIDRYASLCRPRGWHLQMKTVLLAAVLFQGSSCSIFFLICLLS